MPEEQNEEQAPPRQYQQYIAIGGYYPPIPGFLAPGLYDFDLDARTATLILAEPAQIEAADREHGTVEEEIPPPVEPVQGNPPVSNGG